MFSKTFFLLFFIDYAENLLGFSKLGIFWKWVGILIFVKISSISWLGLVPFGVCASVLAPCGNSNMYWGIFSLCSCIFHHCCALLHSRCLTECLSDIFVFVLNSSEFLRCSSYHVYSCLPFWSVLVCVAHFVYFVHQCHALHSLGTL